MKTETLHAVFFSATFSTKRVVQGIANLLEGNKIEHDITGVTTAKEIVLHKNDLLVIGVPVFSGRVPEMALKGIQKIKGDCTPTLIVCVYGNRDYDDALIELRELVCKQGCTPVAAAAIVAQHSIFNRVAANRPDKEDWTAIENFCHKTQVILNEWESAETSHQLQVPGHIPYRLIKNVPIHPTANRSCHGCGACAKLCPTQAIPLDSPQKTNKEKCISCGRCIVVCPQKARNFRGLLFKLASWKFNRQYAERKEPEFFYL